MFKKYISWLFGAKAVPAAPKEIIEAVVAPLVEIPDAVAEAIAEEAVPVKKKRYYKKKKKPTV
jgi:hypothetical protein